MTHTLTPVDYLLIGHITADILPDGGRRLGGTVSYASRVALAFGLRVGILTSARRDEPLLRDLPDAVQVVCVESDQTTTYENIYTDAGRVQKVHGVALQDLRPEHLPPAWITAPLVHFAPVADEAHSPALLKALEGAKYRMATIQGWLRQWDSDGRVSPKALAHPEQLRGLNVVVVSDEDIATQPHMAEKYAESVPFVALTHGERGVTLYQDGQKETHPAPRVVSVDPTGAGDVFATSLLCALNHPHIGIIQALKVAQTLASESVTRVGLDGVPSAERVRALLAR